MAVWSVRDSVTLADIVTRHRLDDDHLPYLSSQGIFSPFLNEHGTDTFSVTTVTMLGEDEFSRILSQNKHPKLLRYTYKSRLSLPLSGTAF